MSLLVLITGTEGWAIEQVEQALAARGHVVGRLEERGPTPADVVVTVRAHPVPNAVRAERGVAEAVAAGVPLVVVGATVVHPFGDDVALAHEGLEGVVDAVEDLLLEAGGDRDPVIVPTAALVRAAHPG